MFDDSFADDGDAAVGGSAATATTGSVLGKRTVATAATATNLSTLLADSSALSAPEMSASAADLMNSSSLSAVPVSVKEMERALNETRKENFDLKLRIYNLETRFSALEEDETRDWRSELAALQQQNDYLKTDNESYKRLLLDAQKAIETLKSGAFHSARLKSLAETNKDLESQVGAQKNEIAALRGQVDSLQQDSNSWKGKAAEATLSAQKALQVAETAQATAAKSSQEAIEDLAFQRAKVLESERDQLGQEVQILRKEAETNAKLLSRYRLEAEGHYTALQTARERLKRVTTVFDQRIAELRQEEKDHYEARIQQSNNQADGDILDRVVKRNALLQSCVQHLDAVLAPSQPAMKASASQLVDQSLFRVFENELLGRLRSLVSIHDVFRQSSKRLEVAYADRMRSFGERIADQEAAVQQLCAKVDKAQTTSAGQLQNDLLQANNRLSELAADNAHLEANADILVQNITGHASKVTGHIKKAAAWVRLLVTADSERSETVGDIAEKLMDLLKQINKSKLALTDSSAKSVFQADANTDAFFQANGSNTGYANYQPF